MTKPPQAKEDGMKRCDDCALFVRRGGGWDLCKRDEARDVDQFGTRHNWRYAEVERKSFLPWKCGSKARHFKEPK